jgi:hypothetical protein
VFVALIFLLRVPERDLSRRFFLLFMFSALAFTRFEGGGLIHAYTTYALVGVFGPLNAALALWILSTYPAMVWSSRGPEIGFPLVFGLVAFASGALQFWVPSPWAFGAVPVADMWPLIVYTIGCLWLLTANFRRSGPAERRQVKWIVYGLFLGTAPRLLWMIAYGMGFGGASWFGLLYVGAELALVAVPVGVLISVVGYQFADIDRIISSTASYSILAVTGLAGILALIPQLAGRDSDSHAPPETLESLPWASRRAPGA